MSVAGSARGSIYYVTRPKRPRPLIYDSSFRGGFVAWRSGDRRYGNESISIAMKDSRRSIARQRITHAFYP